jgi:hypothetical protein
MSTSADSVLVKAKDIDLTKFTVDSHRRLKAVCPDLDDDTIARYLVAGGNDVNQAQEMISKSKQWKSVHYPILKQDCLEELRKGKLYTHGFDKEGRPLLIVRAFNHDPRHRDIEQLAKAALWMIEQAISRLPDDKSKYTIVVDRTDCGMANQDKEFSVLFGKLFRDQHPERIHRIVVYPTGMVFYSFWNGVLKWFMDASTRTRMVPVVKYSGLTEFIDEQYIPATMVRIVFLHFFLPFFSLSSFHISIGWKVQLPVPHRSF